MNLLISNYLAKIGGLSLIKDIKSHFLLCSIEAKGIHQIWKEFYNYADRSFKIIMESDGRVFSITEGNDLKGSRKLHNEVFDLNSEELALIQSTILIIPEILLLDEEYVKTLNDIDIAEMDGMYKLKFTKYPYRYTFIFDSETFLKKEVHLNVLANESPELTIVFDEWTNIDGILYPIKQHYVNPHQTSHRLVETLEFQFYS